MHNYFSSTNKPASATESLSLGDDSIIFDACRVDYIEPYDKLSEKIMILDATMLSN